MGTDREQRRAPLNHAEARLQRALVEAYRAFARTDELLLFAVPNGEKRDAATARRLTGGVDRKHLEGTDALLPFGDGVVPGVCDLILLGPDRLSIYIEVKRPAAPGKPAGRLSKQQKLFRDALLWMDHRHEMVESVEQFLAVLESINGLRYRVRGPAAWRIPDDQLAPIRAAS